MTEAQRRALFALREALHLCDEAHIMLSLNEDDSGMDIESETFVHAVFVYLHTDDIDALLAAHPEPTA